MLNLIAPAMNVGMAMKNVTQTPHQSFGVADFASHVFDVMKQTEAAAIGGMQGQVPMQDVVIKVMEAERTFSAAMAIRDKAVGAYLEISRMQI
jgi:flagellar hook-basal body complex protein FliE